MPGRSTPARFGVSLTRFGGGYLLFCLVAAAAATNTGNNGLYMAASMLLSALAVSGVLSRRNLWRVRLAVEGDVEIHADVDGDLGVRLTWTGSMSPRAVRLEALGDLPTVRPPAIRLNRPESSSVSMRFPVRFAKRGRRPAPDVRVTSAFPFGIFRKTRLVASGGGVTVWPKLLEEGELAVFPPAAHRGDVPSSRPGRSPEIGSLRDFRPGDDPRDIHWKQSARNRRLIYKQRVAEGGGFVSLVLDGSGADAERFERLVSAAATLGVILLARGERVALHAGREPIPPGGGDAHRRRLLDALAEVERNARPLELPLETAGEVRIDVVEVCA